MSLLSKSLYKDGRECPKRAWFGVHHPDWAKAPTDAERARMMEGVEIGRMAARLFSEGIDCRIPGTDDENAAQTNWLLSQGGDLFLEASFMADGLFVRTDILVREGDSWRIIEVKSGGSVKPEHLEDVAFQRHVLERAGLSVSAVEIMHVNREWRSGDSAETFFVREDVTESSGKLLSKVVLQASHLISVVGLETPPEAVLNTFCKECVFLHRCHPEPAHDDLIYLPTIRRDQVARLRASGVSRIGEIPDDFKWNERQRRVWQAIVEGGPIIDPSLGMRLDEIRFPAAFIDFETCMWAQPPWRGLRAYEAVPFQWSMHLVAEDGRREHREYLVPENYDPREEFASELYEHLRGVGSIVYYSNFEVQQLAALVKAGIPFAAELHDLISCQGLDLLKVVQDCVYFPKFRGSFSIKAVLPALVSDLSYKTLQVQNGDMAVQEFKRLLSDGLTEDRKKEVRENLLAYCELDTLAMVRIYEELRKISAGQSALMR